MLSRQPHPRRQHAAVGIGQKLYVWGGEGDHTKIQTSMIESFDLSSESWEQPKPLNRPLPDRVWDMAVTSDGHNTYSFGGTVEGTVFFNTLYQYDISRQQYREVIPTNPSHAPRKQSGGGIVYYNQNLVVYGGFTSEQEYSDELHTFDLRTNLWSAQPTTGKKPPPLAWHTFTKVDQHRAVVFGGFTGKDEVNDTYILDIETWHWTKLVIFGAKPPVRNSHAACCIAGPLTGQEHPLLMLIGGWYTDASLLGDVWLLDVDRSTWTQIFLPVVFTPRRGHSATVFGYGASFRVVVLFGGYMHGGFDSYIEGHFSETTLLLLEPRGGSWQVTRVVKPGELGRPDERLTQQMIKLQLSPQEGTDGAYQTQSTTTDGVASPTTHKNVLSPTHTAKTSSIIDISEVKMGEPIGQGGFGAVFEARWKKRKVAVKVCPGNLIKNLSREIEVLTSLPPHSHVLTFFGVALSSDAVSTYIITELAPNKSLYDYLHVKKETPSLDQSLAWAQQVAGGMQHLHNNNVVHRDLKSGNILLGLGLLAKICDFGTARTLAKTAMTTQKGTYRWMAPEIVEGVEANINKMCDVFSYGMVLYEVFAHKIPYDDLPTDPLVGMAVLQGKRPPVPSTLPPYLRPLLEACWKKEPNERPQFEAIILAIQTETFE